MTAPEPNRRFQLSLQTMLQSVAFVALNMGAFKVAPIVGVVVLAITVVGFLLFLETFAPKLAGAVAVILMIVLLWLLLLPDIRT